MGKKDPASEKTATEGSAHIDRQSEPQELFPPGKPRGKVKILTDATEPIVGSELAAFIILLFRIHKPDGTPQDSFPGQLKNVSDQIASTAGPIRDRMDLLIDHYKDPEIRALIEAAHKALEELFVAMHETGDWGDCKTVSINQIFRIARL
jgi:hypothetical protein